MLENANGDVPEPKRFQEILHFDSEPDACVSLLVYFDENCRGDPLRILTFPTWSEKGSPCCECYRLQEGLI